MRNAVTGAGKLASALVFPEIENRDETLAKRAIAHLIQFLFVTFQFGLLILVIRAFGIENKAFLQLSIYLFFGFINLCARSRSFCNASTPAPCSACARQRDPSCA